ncbi:tetratricopeptide repeat protein [Microbulbifer sp. ZKSA006]|uniref:tetratricopeptide repeat protein n=1 Tax=Microbulbifer sp. ZKSA006 TaxID=3243390 RepID=UPI004039ABCA
MNCWEIIGIPPTVDTRSIKRAYAKKLKVHRPDEDPEGFQTLRAAFEKALKDAKYYQPENTTSDTIKDTATTNSKNPHQAKKQPNLSNTPREFDTEQIKESIEKLQAATAKLYSNFNERIQLPLWQNIYEHEDLWNIETKQHMSLWLFSFIGQNRFIPQEIIEYLESIFYWHENYTWLSQTFSEKFIDYVFNRMITSQWGLSYKGIYVPESTDPNTIETYLAQREHLEYIITNKQDEERDELLAEISKKDIQDPELYRLLSSLFLSQQELLSAREQSDKLAQQYPKLIEGHLTKAAIHYKQRDFKKALESYEAALSIDEDHDIALKGLAACYLEFGDLFSAKCLYEQVSIQTPFDLEARIQLVRINQLLIKENLTKLSDSPEDPKAQIEIAESYIEIGAYSEAIQFILSIINKSIYESGHIGELHHLLGLSYEATNKATEAQNHFTKALEILEENGGNGYYALLKLGEIYINQDQHEKALTLLKKATKYNPDSAKAFELLANAQRCLQLIDEAIENINRAIKLDSNEWHSYSIRSLLLMSTKDYSAAAKDLKVVLRSKPNFALAWHRLGICQNKQGIYDEAMDSYEQALSYDTKLKSAALEWIETACKIKNIESAELAIKAFLNADGSPEEIAEYTSSIESMKNTKSSEYEQQ